MASLGPGRQVFEQAIRTRWEAMPVERRHSLLLVLLCVLVFVPYLGATGFWDPWEPHYGEVARSMIVRRDYVHPYWERAYFFSKPVLSLWMMAAGMLIAGTENGERALGVATEWGVRSMFALAALVAVLTVSTAVRRTLSARAGLWTGIVLATSPLFFLVTRQAMVDLPFVACNTVAISCLLVSLFEKEHVQDGWLYGFWAATGLSMLAKGLLGPALPVLALGGYLVVTGDWFLLRRLRWITGPLMTLLVAGPWYGTMLAFDGVDEESKTFFQRFIVHDHFRRLGSGVHSTTPRSTFTYYVEQLGFGMFPWTALVPGALVAHLRRGAEGDGRRRTRSESARIFVGAWALTSFVFFAFAATKFHHYCFPVLVPLAILVALWIDRLLERGLAHESGPLIVGGTLFALVAQNLANNPSHLVYLFTYNYERAYPWAQVDARRVLGGLCVAAALLALPGLARLRPRTQRAERPSDRRWIVGAVSSLAVILAVYLSAWHWRKLSPHWSQRDLVWTYVQESAPDEPLGAYLMNWRGETFYTRNRVKQLTDADALRRFAALPGREWVLVEHHRLDPLKTALGGGYAVRVLDRTSNKYVLASIEDAVSTGDRPDTGAASAPPR